MWHGFKTNSSIGLFLRYDKETIFTVPGVGRKFVLLVDPADIVMNR